MKWDCRFSRRRDTGKERGAVAVFTALACFFIIPGFAALAVDIGRYMFERQQLQDALDAGALVGAQFLPHNEGLQAASMARAFALKNDPDLAGVPLDIRFGCLVSAEPATPTVAMQGQVNALCHQYSTLMATFTCPGNGKCYRPCEFLNLGDSCNAISVGAKIEVPLMLARAIPGQNLVRMDADLVAHACRGSEGSCGPPQDLNLVLLLDRSSTMKTHFSQVAEGAKAILESPQLNPEFHQVALGVFPACPTPEEVLAGCNQVEDILKTPLTTEYAGLVYMIEHLQSEGAQTDIATAISKATERLLNAPLRHLDRQVANYIILLTDGAPSVASVENECALAFSSAGAAREQDIQIYTIGYFADSNPSRCSPSDFLGRSSAELLQEMTHDNHSPTFTFTTCLNANQDGDHFYCELKGEDLQDVFNSILASILNDLGGSSLVDLSGYVLN